MIMWVVYNKGPVATLINAGDRHFQLYRFDLKNDENGLLINYPSS